MSRSRKVVVTGGSGFIGANLVRRLLRDGHSVHLLLRQGYSAWRIEAVRGDVMLHIIDSRDQNQLTDELSSIRPEWVFHLAVNGAYPEQTDAEEMFRTNVLGTMHLVQACMKSGFGAFVNTGSSSEYGFKKSPPSERDLPEPNSDYAVTKAAATLYCRYIAQRYGLCIPTLRLYSIFGPFERPGRLIPTLIVKGQKGELPPLVDPDISRDFVYVEDAVEAYILAAATAGQEPGAVYNVGSGTRTSIRSMVEIARKILDIRSEPEWSTMKKRIWDTADWQADPTLIRDRLGWQPTRDIAGGFAETVAWLRNSPELWETYGINIAPARFGR
jgi:UDP-glucose 4-epimerase